MSRTFPDISGRSNVPAGTIAILGDVELFCGDKFADLRRQLRKALAVMVAARGRRVRRQEIAVAVWGDEARDVRTLMWSLRRALRDCDSGFDVPADKGKEGNYVLAVAEPGTLDEAVDAFRFLALTERAEARWKRGEESTAVEELTIAAGLWRGEPFADLWPDGVPEACRRLAADLERARDFLVRALAETALRHGAPYEPARAHRNRPVWPSAADLETGHDAAWLAGFLITLHDRPGADEADLLLARRRGAGAGRERLAGDRAVARADDLLQLAESGIDVHRPPAAVPRPPVAGSPATLVGREAEQAAFRHVLGEVRAGHPAALAVQGASGRGKTRLAGEFAAMAVAAGVPVAEVSAGPPGDLRPWRDLAARLWPAACRDLGAGRDSAGQGSAGPDRAMARLTLGQRRALLDFVAPRAGAASPPEPDQAQQVRFAEIARALSVLARNTAARQGLTVVLDDADRLSERGRELLDLVLGGLRDAPVGMVLLGRDGAWADALTAARPGAARLRLGPLPERAIGDWLRQVRGAAPTGAEIQQVAQATGGEPVRIRDQVAADQRAAAAAAPVPSRWLAAAAITADDLVIDTALVARMLDLPDADADAEEGNARRLAWIDTSAGVRFTHGSHRDDAIAWLDADPALRRSLHRRAFEVLAGDGRGEADDPDPSRAVRLAGHALGADRDLPAAAAARAFLAAARAERASGEAAEAWARAGIAKSPADPATRACLHLALGDALDQRGSVTEADREYQLAYDVADRPVEQAEALIRLARRWTDPGKLDWYLLRGLRDGIAGLTPDTPGAAGLRLQLTAHLARKSTLAVPVVGTEADEIRREGVALARAALDELGELTQLPPAVTCEVLNECRWALFDYDPPADTIRLSERLERESLVARSPYFQSEALMTLAIDQLRLGQVTDAQSTLLAHERTMPATYAAQWLQLTMETVLDLWYGRFGAAEARLLQVAGPIVTRAHEERAQVADTLQQTWQGQLYWLRRERGQALRQTEPEVFRQIEGHAFFAIWRVGLALTSAEENDAAAAAVHVRALDEGYGGFAAFPPHGWTVSVAALLAETCLALSPASRPGGAGPFDDLLPDVARRLRAILGRYAGEFVLAGWPSVLLGPAERFSGLLAMATGEHEEALHLLDAAAVKVADAPPQAARLQVNKARALLRLAERGGGRAGQVAAARLLAEAGAAADRLGMRGLAAEASALLAEH
jgi:AAA ATPase domain/Bacterial transcriptional activator domain